MKPVTPLDILRITKNNKWFYMERELTKGEIDNLKAEAELIVKTSLWKLLISEGKYHAQKMAFIDADTKNDAKDLIILRQAQQYLKVATMFSAFINKITIQ